MFGSTNNQAKPLFGSTTATTTPSPFTLGASTTNTSSPFSLGATSNNNTSNQQQGASMFNKPAFGQTTTSTQPAQSGGLFGASTTNNTQQQQPATSLLGNTNNTNNTTNQQSGGGLFGSTPAAQSQPQQNSSLFGGQNTTSNTSGTNSLFGQTNNNTQNATQNKPPLSLFAGNSNTSTAQPNSTSLFGASTAQSQPQQPTNSLFGASTTNRPLGSTLGLGQSTQNAAQQTVPGVKIDLSNIRGTTRFNDLHDDLQKQIEALDNFITQQIQFKEQCDALMPSHADSLSTIPNDVSFVQSKLETTELALDNDTAAIDAMKAVIRKDADNARLSFKAVENLKLPQQFHYSGMWQTNASSPGGGTSNNSDSSNGGPVDLVSFVSGTADEFAKSLAKYQGHVAEIEAHLGTLEANVVFQSQQLMFSRGRDGGLGGRDEQIRELGAVLREFDDGIVKVARRVGQVKEEALGVVEVGDANAGGRYAR